MRLRQRGVGWIFAGLVGIGSAGCQTIAQPDRDQIPGDGGVGGNPGGGGEGGGGGAGGN